jgi:hypothetical protein
MKKTIVHAWLFLASLHDVHVDVLLSGVKMDVIYFVYVVYFKKIVDEVEQSFVHTCC